MKIDSKLLAWVGFGLMVLGLLLGYIRVLDVDMMEGTSGYKGLGLIFNMGMIGELCGFGYVLSILAIAVTAYAGYVTFVKPEDYMKAALAAAAAFVILFIGYYILRGSVNSQLGMFAGFIKMTKMGLASWLYLLGAAAFYFAAKGIPSPLNIPGVKTDTTENAE